MTKWARDHSLSLVLFAILIAFMATSFVTGTHQFTSEQPPFTWPTFFRWWTYETTTSLEADVFGAIILVLFTKWFFEKRSAEAKDPPDG